MREMHFSVDRNPENLKLTEKDVEILKGTPELLKILIPGIHIEEAPESTLIEGIHTYQGRHRKV